MAVARHLREETESSTRARPEFARSAKEALPAPKAIFFQCQRSEICQLVLPVKHLALHVSIYFIAIVAHTHTPKHARHLFHPVSPRLHRTRQEHTGRQRCVCLCSDPGTRSSRKSRRASYTVVRSKGVAEAFTKGWAWAAWKEDIRSLKRVAREAAKKLASHVFRTTSFS